MNMRKYRIFATSIERKYSVQSEPFINGNSSLYLEQMYEAWLNNKNSVHSSWNAYFTNITSGKIPGEAFSRPHLENSSLLNLKDYKISGKLLNLIRFYQAQGFRQASLDPLKLDNRKSLNDSKVLKINGFDINDLDRKFSIPKFATNIGGNSNEMTLREIINNLKEAYCGFIGVEYKYILSKEQRIFIRDRIENREELTIDERLSTLLRLLRTTKFEEFLSRNWPAEKRFGIEGCESLIPLLKTVIDSSTEKGVNNFVFGMPHRGRLNVLSAVCDKSLDQIFCCFNSFLDPSDEGSGDVKYHIGVTQDIVNSKTKKEIKVSLVANPSHLEAVSPVVQGKTKATQFYTGDIKGDHTMSIIMHGDASFAGQGVVYETFHLSHLPDYTTHGTIHVVVNNQIGFTTDPRFSRSSEFCTDVAKVVASPIFHVNSDDVDSVVRVAKLAAEFRSAFKTDVVIDLIGYRRNGHNETDEPMFTQPLMYEKIRSIPNVYEKYSKKLINEGLITQKQIDDECTSYFSTCEKALKDSNKIMIKTSDWVDSKWIGNYELRQIKSTGISIEKINNIANIVSSAPADDFSIHPVLLRTLKKREKMVKSGVFDWALAECFAFGSTLMEGFHVRLSGQDVQRGTFSHRHHVIHDQVKDLKTFIPLNNLSSSQAFYHVCNSSLSEYAVLGFEHGYSLQDPNSLVIWEAQFGDFANGGQIIIDQFLSSGEAKWGHQSGIVLLLPHGYEGMGPEHSSARLERFLQLSCEPEEVKDTYNDYFGYKQLKDSSWFIVNCSTPANFFHVLRRQVNLPFRKPLVVMSPKNLLRLPEAQSKLDEILPGTIFKRVIGDEGNKSTVKRIILTSGKIYYDLVKSREKHMQISTTAIIRVEQLSPFPFDLISSEISSYPNVEDILWVQEEPKNMGAWTFVAPRINNTFKECGFKNYSIRYVGRPISASPAAGHKLSHYKELEVLLETAFS